MHGRNLAIMTISFLTALIGGGTALFHAIEDWTWIESFYFTIATITTVGYGDIAPSNDGSRLITALFILFGVAIGVGILRYLAGTLIRSKVKKRAIRQESKETEK